MNIYGSSGYLLRLATMGLQVTDKLLNGSVVLPFGAEQQFSSGKIEEEGQVLVPFSDGCFVNTNMLD